MLQQKGVSSLLLSSSFDFELEYHDLFLTLYRLLIVMGGVVSLALVMMAFFLFTQGIISSSMLDVHEVIAKSPSLIYRLALHDNHSHLSDSKEYACELDAHRW